MIEGEITPEDRVDPATFDEPGSSDERNGDR
jgi:hypothetical protein